MNAKKLLLLTCISLRAATSAPLYSFNPLETIQNSRKDHTDQTESYQVRKGIYNAKKTAYRSGIALGATGLTLQILKSWYQKRPILGTKTDTALVLGSLATSLFSGYKWYTLAPLPKRVRPPVQPEPINTELQDDVKDAQEKERAALEAANKRAEEAAQIERDRIARETKAQVEAELARAEERQAQEAAAAKAQAETDEKLFAERLAEAIRKAEADTEQKRQEEAAERQAAAKLEQQEEKAETKEVKINAAFEAYKKLVQDTAIERKTAAEEARKYRAQPIALDEFTALVNADIALCKTYLNTWYQHADISPAEKTALLELCRDVLAHDNTIRPYEFLEYNFAYATEVNVLMKPFWELETELEAAQMALIPFNREAIGRSIELWHRLGATHTRDLGKNAAEILQNFYAPHIEALHRAAAVGNKLAQEHVAKLQGDYYTRMLKPD